MLACTCGLRVSRSSISSTDVAQARIDQEEKLRMETSPQIVDPTRDSGSVSISSAVAETALFDLPDTTPWTHLAAAWLFGAVVLAGLVVFIMHFGAIEIFLATLRRARPAWLAAAVSCQMVTYVCAAAVWFRVLGRAGSPLPFLSLLRLALAELFANQAIPTGGLSGSVMVMRGLTRRGVTSAIAVTALLIAALSYYAAYLLVGLLAFVLLWHSGDLNAAWRALFIAFAIVVATLGMALLILSRTRDDLIPAAILRWRPFARLASMLSQVRVDMLHNPRLICEVIVLQSGIFLLDAATLWCAGRAVGLNVDVGSTFMSFILASVVATLSPIPLGLGSFEGTCTGLLHLMGGGLEASLAATLILRGFTLWLPMLPGLWVIRREAATEIGVVGTHLTGSG
jgi:glycosyltransferase 2 family protein